MAKCELFDITKHLGTQRKVQETVQCPFLDCEFKTAHKKKDSPKDTH